MNTCCKMIPYLKEFKDNWIKSQTKKRKSSFIVRFKIDKFD